MPPTIKISSAVRLLLDFYCVINPALCVPAPALVSFLSAGLIWTVNPYFEHGLLTSVVLYTFSKTVGRGYSKARGLSAELKQLGAHLIFLESVF